MNETIKRILAEAFERVLREHKIKIESIHVSWDERPGNVPEHRYIAHGIEIQGYLKE